MKTDNNNEPIASHEQDGDGRSTAPTLLVDYQKYAALLGDTDLTESEKREFIDAIWGIIVDFVSLGFSVHSLQQVEPNGAAKICGASGDGSEKSLSIGLANMVLSGQSNQQEKSEAAIIAKRLESEES